MDATSESNDNGEESEESSLSSSSSPASSPLSTMAPQFRSVLDEFRERWREELKTETPSNKTNDKKSNSVDSSNTSPQFNETGDQKAERLFLQGVELEKKGQVYDALNCYRRAVQIVPDIEFKIHESNINPIQLAKSTEADSNDNIVQDNHQPLNDLNVEKNEDDEDLSNVDLYARFQSALAKSDTYIQKAIGQDLSRGAHISNLPTEIILYILRWVVSTNLDTRSLEQCSAVCKGLYLCARDEEIWRLACLKVWGLNVDALKGTSFGTYRQMYMERPRVHFNGCYISKTNYLRYGENSFQDQFYRPIQLIEYYRYLRFFPDGKVLMMTSADDPAQCVGKLKISNQFRQEIHHGHYRLHGNVIVIVLKRNTGKPSGEINRNTRRRISGVNNSDSQSVNTFYLDFNIVSTIKRRFSQLQWQRYSIVQTKNNREVSTDFDMTPAKYPPLSFSRVKSYHLESEVPLM